MFTHQPAGAPARSVIYGRIDHGVLALPDCAAPRRVTFLTWYLVFARSGLPAALAAWQAAPLGLLGDFDDWHQLDHYTALTLALAPNQRGTLVPFAVTFQHHNYLRSFLLAVQDGPGSLSLPRTVGSRSTSRCAPTSFTRTGPVACCAAPSRS